MKQINPNKSKTADQSVNRMPVINGENLKPQMFKKSRFIVFCWVHEILDCLPIIHTHYTETVRFP